MSAEAFQPDLVLEKIRSVWFLIFLDARASRFNWQFLEMFCSCETHLTDLP